jgi:hypothetical protein
MPEILNKIRKGLHVDHYETMRRRKDGETIHVSLTISPVRDKSGQIIGASKIARDITERKLAERALLEQAEQLARSNTDLQQFSHLISHDLQEPLRTIASFSELLKRDYSGRLDQRAEQYIDFIVAATTRMAALIRDALAYSITTGQLNPPGQVSSKLMVESAIANLQGRIQESGASIELGELPVVVADQVSLTHVFQILISNAIKYLEPETPPRIHIYAEVNEGEDLFSVVDNGIGISAPYHKTIFELFRRLDWSERDLRL